MSSISTHVLDTVLGKPASGVPVRLEQQTDSGWLVIATSATDLDGRCRNLGDDAPAGIYCLTFETGHYFEGQGRTSIYPEISITFRCGADAHYHLPLLLSDNSYTTYRGS
jgi:5-hydroxyisourate hydrolase